MKIKILGTVLIGLVTLASCNNSGSDKTKSVQEDHQMEAKMYTCTMHPEVMMDKPGDCPKCGMKLVEKTEMNHDKMEHMDAKMYTCTMHPEVMMDKPGDCPKCGMKLVEMKDKEHTEHEHNHE
ncbi:MAG: hypothetical protein GXO79_15165 [Chlorobi bacterium]|nr:hypothetical protein [Chlorobiota bacterium]